MNHYHEVQNMWMLPFPASEKMNSLIILYLEVLYTVIFIFLIIIFIFAEIFILFKRESKINNYLDWIEDIDRPFNNVSDLPPSVEELFYFTPIHITPEDQHFADIGVIFFPTILILQIMIPTLGYLYNEEMLYYDTYISFDVNIVGNQWYWTYEYIVDFSSWSIDIDKIESEPLFLSFDSVITIDGYKNRLLDVDKPLILPVHTNILLSFTSRDVIHSWALPQMGIKVDCIPGRITHTIFSSFALGVYYGQCSELCGALHGFMPICVEVVPYNFYLIWLLITYKEMIGNDLAIYNDLILTASIYSCLNWDISDLQDKKI